jgi:hypothetical protein
MKKLMMLSIVALVFSCSSRKLEREYKVVDASHAEVPEWISEYEEFIDDLDNKDFSYYKYETGPKNNREMACKIAKAEAASHVAGELKTKIKDVLTTSTEGDATEVGGKLDEYVSNTMVMDIESSLSGLKVAKSYWEKRAYSKDLGAVKEFRAWSCSVLLKISKKDLKSSLAKVEAKAVSLAPNKAKENVKNMIDKIVQ